MDVVVRAFGSGRCHVANVPPDAIKDSRVLGIPVEVVELSPVVTVCRVELKQLVLVMAEANGVCRTCSKLTGVTKVADGQLE